MKIYDKNKDFKLLWEEHKKELGLNREKIKKH